MVCITACPPKVRHCAAAGLTMLATSCAPCPSLLQATCVATKIATATLCVGRGAERDAD